MRRVKEVKVKKVNTTEKHATIKLSKAGSLTIPKRLRRLLGMQAHGLIGVDVLENGEIRMRVVNPVCGICGIGEAEAVLKGVTVCGNCISEVMRYGHGEEDSELFEIERAAVRNKKGNATYRK